MMKEFNDIMKKVLYAAQTVKLNSNKKPSRELIVTGTTSMIVDGPHKSLQIFLTYFVLTHMLLEKLTGGHPS